MSLRPQPGGVATVVSALTAAAALAALVVWTDAPASAQALKSAPIFPGATADAAATKAVRSERADSPGLIQSMSGARRSREALEVYSTRSGIEDVYRFYVAQLGAKPLTGDLPDPFALKSGGSTPVQCDSSFYESELEDQLSDATGQVMRSGVAVRKKLAGSRKPLDGGQWLTDGVFDWASRNAQGVLSIYRVHLQDESFSDDYAQYAVKTWIIVESASIETSK